MPGDLPDDFVRVMLLAAGERGCVFHEETRPAGIGQRRAITAGETGAAILSRFTVCLPDTRLVSSVTYEPRLAALETICRALAPYLVQFEPIRGRLDRSSPGAGQIEPTN